MNINIKKTMNKDNELLFNFLGVGEDAPTYMWVYSSEMEFNTNWNWLMKVVEKIDRIEVNKETFSVDIYQIENLLSNVNRIFLCLVFLTAQTTPKNLAGEQTLTFLWL